MVSRPGSSSAYFTVGLLLGKRVTMRGLAALALTYAGLMLVFAQMLGSEQRDFWLGALGNIFGGSTGPRGRRRR